MTKIALKNGEKALQKKRYVDAIVAFESVLKSSPKNVSAHVGLASCYAQLNKWLEALNAILNALGYGNYQQKELVLFIKILDACQLNSYVEPIESALKVAIKSKWLEGSAAIHLTNQLFIKYHKTLSHPVTCISEEIESMYRDESLHIIIERKTTSSFPLEQILLLGRKEMLRCAVNNQDISHYVPFVAALACQNLLNHNLYHTSDEELTLLNQLNENKNSLLKVLMQLCYVDFQGAIEIWQENKILIIDSNLTSLIDDLTLYEKVIDAANKKINSIQITDHTSQTVQSFYAENPYPKFKSINVSTITINDMRLQLGQKTLAAPNALIAGCGTGLQALEMAFSNPTALITAIDLSPTSLAYGELKAEQLGLTNIQFKLLDILEVDSLEQTFDFIMCTGVLHHMNSPQAGLNALSSVLKSDGSMIIGLYSKLARKELKEMQSDAISYLNMGVEQITKKDVILWRANLTEEQKAKVRYQRHDCFNINGIMDCLFHPQQAEFSPIEIQALLDRAKMTFNQMAVSGFCRVTYQKEMQSFPPPNGVETLAYWHEFEIQNPDFFKGMINFFITQ
jgi:2-polyprenyl-3-methyl-5-hydroxy-6-metoxy-1,4-benzoquinol methylase